MPSETVLTVTHREGVRVRVVNCFDCGGAFEGGPLVPGASATCVRCRTAWRLVGAGTRPPP